ncbi:MAG: citramalate synthase [Candidatus Goldbacteria bacterium]|nr:citramalate synthase [Candidatus Goldiibacteriota bacterium]
MKSKKIYIYDTTLRDGAQSARVNFSLEDKLLITKKLDELRVDFIEGGWPMKGVNTKDFEYFKRVKKLKLKNSKIVAFGSTRRAKNKVKNDPVLNSLLEADTEVVTIFGKTWILHVKNVLHITPEENLQIIKESIEYLKDNKKIVIYDAEHFFDGYKDNPEYAIKCLKIAEQAGADFICLCDTNGGTLPQEMDMITMDIFENIKTPLGIHTHNDSELAVANSLIAVKNGFVMVQGTINGFGERCGNANLISIIPALSLKMGYDTIPTSSLKKLTEISHYIYEIANIIPPDNQPYTGKNAFAHKAGVHADAMLKEEKAYEHINPEIIGNSRKILITDQAGTSSLIYKAKEMGFKLDKNDQTTKDLIIKIKKLESEGYEFEAADASLFIFLKKNLSHYKPFFELKGLRVINEERNSELFTEATIKIKVKDILEHTAAEGNGPVNALDNALRKALIRFYPSIKNMRLVDFKVRVIDGADGTAAKVRVLIESTDNKDIWTTVGVSENIIEASWLALVDSVEYKLLKDK